MTEPLNPLETVMREAMAGTATMDQFFATLKVSRIVVPSATKPDANGDGLSPLVYGREGVDMIVAFTDPSRSGRTFREKAQYEFTVDGAWLIQAMAPQVGLILYSGPDVGIHLMPEQLAALRQSL